MASAASTTPATTVASAGANSVESLLAHVQSIEGDRARLLRELEEAKAKIGQLSETKQAEMRQALDNVIMKMIKDSVQDQKVQEEFEAGMKRLVDETAENNGVWQVMACASANYNKKLEDFAKLEAENTELKSKLSGQFHSEESRKRPATEAPSTAAGDVWADFADTMKGRGPWTPAL